MASQPLQSTSTNQLQSGGKVWTIDDLGDLLNILHPVAHKCIDFGIQLGIPDHKMQAIEEEHSSPSKRLREILRYRLRQAPLTMYDIVQALQSNCVQEKQLASRIESQYKNQPSVSAHQQVTCIHMPTAPYPHTHQSVSSSTLQPNVSTFNTQLHPSPQPAPHIQVLIPVPVDNSSSQSSQPLCSQLHPPQYQPSCPPPNPPTPTPSQPQVEAAQSPSSSQPSSSQLMSVPVTSQAMPGPSPQLSQDVAAPHPLQVGGQQTLQGQPPLQHVPRHQPQTQPHDTGFDSGPPQAMRVRYKSHMAQYIDYVRTLYRQSAVEKKLNTIKWPPTPSIVYINLVCVDRTTHVSTKEADECTRAMVEDGSVDVILKKKTPINFSDIAKDVPLSEKKVILVEGAPGVGKSTLAWEFCRRWERGEIAQQYQLVLLLRLRDKEISKAQSLSDLLHHPSKAVVQAVEDELIATLGANTLIILEGFDELPSTCRTEPSVFLRLINGELPHATVLVTSRPWATQNIHIHNQRIFQHIEILGFTGKQIEKYVTSVFTEEGKPADDKAIEEVMSYIKTYPQIKACMYIPLNSAIVVSVYQESKAGKNILPRTLTELYYALAQTLLLRYLYGHPEYGQRRWKIQSLKEDLPADVYSKLLAISELAYSGICGDQESSVQLIYTDLPHDFETLGLMQSVPQLYVTRGEDMSYNFLHLTVQEFLAALHISNMSPEKQLEHFQRQREGRWRVVLRFLAGITKLANLSQDDLRGLLPGKPDIMESTHSITADIEVSIQHVNWMFETQRDDIELLVLQKMTVECRTHQGLTPLDYYTLGYFIAHSHCQWVLTVDEGGLPVSDTKEEVIGEEEVKMLVAGADTKHDTNAKVVGLGCYERMYDFGYYTPLSISAKALNLLFTGLQDVLHLQKMHLVLPAECCSIAWPNLSGLRVLHLQIIGEKNWRLDSILPDLTLESLTIEVRRNGGGCTFDNVASIGELFLSSKCPKYVDITDNDSSITAEVAIDEQIRDNHSENRTSSVHEDKDIELIRCRLDYYSLGYIIVHSHYQWVLKTNVRLTNKVISDKDIRMLVDGANTRHNTSARVVGLRGDERYEHDGGGYDSLSISAEALNVLFTGLQHIFHLQELHLILPVECCSIVWPKPSRLQVLHLTISSERNWRLDTLLPHLSLESMTIECTRDGCLGIENAVAIGQLLLNSNYPKHVDIHIKDDELSITAKGTVGHKRELENEAFSVQEKCFVKFIRHHQSYYSLGYCITHSHYQWVLTVEEGWIIPEIGVMTIETEEKLKALVAGANTRPDTSARVVGLICGQRGKRVFGVNDLWSISAEVLNALLTGLEHMIHLHKLHLNLSVECCSITWPNLSGLQVLHLRISDERNWRLDTLLPQLSLESLAIESTEDGGTVVLEDCAAIGMLLSSSNHLKCLQFLYRPGMTIDVQNIQSLTKAMSENESLPLRYLVVEWKFTFSDTAAYFLALFIRKCTTLHYLSLRWCTFSANGLLELTHTIHQSSSLQEVELEGLTCTIHGDDEATDFAQCSVDYPLMRECLKRLDASNVTDRGAQAIASILEYNSTLEELNLSSNSASDTGSTHLAQALRHNSTLRRLNLSGNSFSDAGLRALLQFIYHNSTLEELNLSNNSISDTGLAALAFALHHNYNLESAELV